MDRRGELREAYVPNLRVRLASDVASLCAAAVLIGLLGTALTWWDRSALFDLAASSGEVVKMGTGYLAGPVAILVERVAGLDGYTLEAGTFVTGGLILVGLLATLAMWPHDLAQAHVNAAGRIRPLNPHQTSQRKAA